MTTELIVIIWIVQTLIGAVLWRKFTDDSAQCCFWVSFLVIPNLGGLIYWTLFGIRWFLIDSYRLMLTGINILAGKDVENN